MFSLLRDLRALSNLNKAIRCGAEALAREHERAYLEEEQNDVEDEVHLVRYFKMHLHAPEVVQSNDLPVEGQSLAV